MDEKRAVKALKQGNADALEWLIECYAGYVNTIIYNIIGGTMTAFDVEEVVSDVFLALWENADKAKVNTLKAYLGSIARNKAKNKLRELAIEVPIEDDFIIVSDSTPESKLIDTEQRVRVKKAVLSMRHPDREVFLRHYYYYQGVAQIAEEMDMNVSTVKTRLVRGRQKLKEILNDGGNFDGNENNRFAGLHTR